MEGPPPPPFVPVPSSTSAGQTKAGARGAEASAGGPTPVFPTLNPDFWYSFHRDMERRYPMGDSAEASDFSGIFADKDDEDPVASERVLAPLIDLCSL